MNNAINAFLAGSQLRDRQNQAEQAQGQQNAMMQALQSVDAGRNDKAMHFAAQAGPEGFSAIRQQVQDMDDRQRQQARDNLQASAGLAMAILDLPEPERPAFIQQNAGTIKALGIDPQQVLSQGTTDRNLRAYVRMVQGMDAEMFSDLVAPVTLGENDTRVDPLSGRQTIGQAGQEARQLEGFANQTQRMNAQTARDRGNSPLVSVNTAQPQQDPFRAAIAEADTDALTEIMATGDQAARNIVEINQLEQLLSRAPQGRQGALVALANNFGIQLEGADDVAAANALINRLIPAQRPPGSGTLSDADIAMYRQSLPRIINQPGGNQRIIETIRAINEHDRRAAEIVRTSATPEEARQRLSQLQNPLNGMSGASVEQNAGGLTPEERQELEELERRFGGQ